MEWRSSSGIITDIIDNSVDGLLDMTMEWEPTSAHQKFNFTAELYFQEYEGILLPNCANNIPTYSHMSKYGPITVHCECAIAINEMCGME